MIKAITIISFFFFFYNNFGHINDSSINYSGTYALDGKISGINENDKKCCVERFGERIYLKLKNLETGEYEIKWDTNSDKGLPQSIETISVFISKNGKISGESTCILKIPPILLCETRAGMFSSIEKYPITRKYIFEGKFKNSERPTLKLKYKIIGKNNELLMNGWSEGIMITKKSNTTAIVVRDTVNH
jgi:hypothetical protein